MSLIKKYPIAFILAVIGIFMFFFKDKIMFSITSMLGKNFRVSSPFGERIHPVTKKKQDHNGIDLATPVGTPIYAEFDGIVSTSNKGHAGGNELYLSSAEQGLRLGYAHLRDFVVKAGMVKKGQLLAHTGNGGTGPHLHFTVTTLIDNKKVNPLNYFKA